MARRGKFQRTNGFMQPHKADSNHQIGVHVPMHLVLLGHFSHACMDEAICQVQIDQVPYFNAFIYATNRQPIGKVDDVFGKLHEFSVSIRLNDPKLVKTLKQGDEFFIEPQKLLPMMRFLPKPRTTIKNVTAKTKLKGHAKNKFNNTGRSGSGTRGRGGTGKVNSRGGGRRYPQNKNLFQYQPQYKK